MWTRGNGGKAGVMEGHGNRRRGKSGVTTEADVHYFAFISSKKVGGLIDLCPSRVLMLLLL